MIELLTFASDENINYQIKAFFPYYTVVFALLVIEYFSHGRITNATVIIPKVL